MVIQPRMVSKEEFLGIFETLEDDLSKVVLATTILYHPMIYSEKQPLDPLPCVSRLIVHESCNILKAAPDRKFEAEDSVTVQ